MYCECILARSTPQTTTLWDKFASYMNHKQFWTLQEAGAEVLGQGYAIPKCPDYVSVEILANDTCNMESQSGNS